MNARGAEDPAKSIPIRCGYERWPRRSLQAKPGERGVPSGWFRATLAMLALAGTALAAPPQANPYAYDVSPFTNVPAALLRYDALPPLAVPVAYPRALAADAQGRLYVGGSNELAVLDQAGAVLQRFALASPARCLAVTDAGDILVGASEHVDVYSPTGGLRESWVSLGEKALLTSIATRRDRVFVADAGSHVVWRLDVTGRLLGMIGADAQGGKSKHFVIPSPYFDVAVGAQDDVWIVNPGEHLLERYTLDGRFAVAWGRTAMTIEGFCGCCNPVHMALRADGAFVTSEKGLPRIKVYAPDGTLSAVVAGPATLAAGGPVPDANLSCSVEGAGLDLATDPAGHVFALDALQAVIRVYRERANP